MSTVEWCDVTFQYPDADQPALTRVHLSVRAGEFVALAGPTGSGKTTLLRLLKREVAPGGRMSGVIRVQGQNIANATAKAAASSIGLVMQHPDQQLVVDTVEHELAFGMENLGMPKSLMRRRMAEIAGFFGLEPLLHRRTDELSGGQKMTVNLAAVLMLQPRVLLLDEPLAQLDPLAARDLLGMIKRLNEEWGVTVIMSEHRMDDLLPLADRLVWLDRGTVVFNGAPREFAREAWRRDDRQALEALPEVTRWAFHMRHNQRPPQPDLFPPLSVKEARMWTAEQRQDPAAASPVAPRPQTKQPQQSASRPSLKPLLRANGLFFAYDKQSPV